MGAYSYAASNSAHAKEVKPRDNLAGNSSSWILSSWALSDVDMRMILISWSNLLMISAV